MDLPPQTGPSTLSAWAQGDNMFTLTDIAELATLIALCVGGVWALLLFWNSSTESKELRIQAAEKANVNQSINGMLEVMKEFRLSQKETDKTVNELKMSVLEVKIQIATHKELLEKFFRDMTIDTGDGYKIDPRKANKQK
jgi:hypothetical protein